MPLATRIIVAWVILFAGLARPASLPEEGDDSGGRYYIVKVWGADDGLTEGSVTDVAQTPEGYLWIGTLFGSVLRFDGTRFVSYSSANTPEFSLKWGVPRLMVDQQGTLWISMYDGGMTEWNEHGFRSAFSSTNHPNHLLWSAPGKVVFFDGGSNLLAGQRHGEHWDWQTTTLSGALPQSQACADSQGRVWYLCGVSEIGIRDGAESKTFGLSGRMESQSISVLTADGQGNIWIGTDQQLARWNADHFEVMTPADETGGLKVKRIVPSGTKELWVEGNGRMRRYRNGKWVAESDGWNRELSGIGALRFVHGDADGGLWSGVGDLGLIHVLPDGTFHRLTTRDGLPSDRIHFAYQDRDGNTWTGYDRGGLVQIRRRLFHVVGQGEGLNENLINTVCQDSQGTVWIGTHGGAVWRYQNGSSTNLDLPAIAREPDSIVTSDARGRTWISAQGAGLFMWQGGHMQEIATQADLHGYVRLMLPARDGRLWAGTLLSIVSIADGKLNCAYTAQTTGDHPTALAETTDGAVWAGTLAGNLLRWDGEHFVAVTPPDRDLLGRILALWPSPDGGLWAGTAEGGLLHLVRGQFQRFTSNDGLPSDCIVQILGDTQGNLWLGTRAGIVRVALAALGRFEPGKAGELPVSVYGQSDGLSTIGSAIMFQPNCWRGRDGRLFFAMANSVAEVMPEEAQGNSLPPTVVLEEFCADDKHLALGRVGSILSALPLAEKRPQNLLPSIKAPPADGDLEFFYTGLSLKSPSRVRFKYKLEGLENSWKDAGSEKRAVYRHVPPGKYVFHVRACNSDGQWSPDGALLAVTVEPHFYQTAWFLGCIGLSGGAALVLMVLAAARRRMDSRLEQLKRQRALERERARIAQDLHDELGAGLTEIGLLGGLLQNPSRFSERKQPSLERIVQRCRDLVVALDEIVWAVNPRNDSVNSLNGYLCRYAQGFLETTTIRCRLDMQEAQPDRPFDSEQRHHIFLAFKEALTNVAKHSEASEVNIRMCLESQNRLLISIEDNGRGLPSSVGTDTNGLTNLRTRMAHIGGECDIVGRAGGGVIVLLGLPLKAG
jgi:signal transduction histidine kinase/ligand-binding sensor domain-containing protein